MMDKVRNAGIVLLHLDMDTGICESLLVRNRKQKKKLEFPGGKQKKSDFSLHHTAIREFEEETGHKFPDLFNVYFICECHSGDFCIYVYFLFSKEPFVAKPSKKPNTEIVETKWISLNHIKQNMLRYRTDFRIIKQLRQWNPYLFYWVS